MKKYLVRITTKERRVVTKCVMTVEAWDKDEAVRIASAGKTGITSVVVEEIEK